MTALWVSPLGPLKISVGYPINAKPDDRKQIFQFTFGGAF
jgi:outer membrane protein insertion porin family